MAGLYDKFEDIFKPASEQDIRDRIKSKFKVGDKVRTAGGVGEVINITDRDMLIKWTLEDEFWRYGSKAPMPKAMTEPMYYSFDNEIDRKTLRDSVYVINEGREFEYAFFEEDKDIFAPIEKDQVKKRNLEFKYAEARQIQKEFPVGTWIKIIRRTPKSNPLMHTGYIKKYSKNGLWVYFVFPWRKGTDWKVNHKMHFSTLDPELSGDFVKVDKPAIVEADIFKPAKPKEVEKRKALAKQKEEEEKRKRLEARNQIPATENTVPGKYSGDAVVNLLGKRVHISFTCDIEGGSPQTFDDPGEPAYPVLMTITEAEDDDGNPVPITEALMDVASDQIRIDNVDLPDWDEPEYDDY